MKAETKELEDTREFQSAWRNAEIAAKRLLEDKPYLRDFEELFQLAHHAPYCPEVPKYIQEGTDWHQRVYSMGFDFGVKESLKIAGVEENQEDNPGRVRESLRKPEGGNPGFTTKEAKSIGEKLGIDFKRYDVEQFRQGLNVELEHCNVTNCDPILTGKIAQAHLNELADYYTRLAKMEANSMKTETERKSFHERVFGKGSTPPLERLGRGQVANNLIPMSPTIGPPLPRGFQLKWPWKK